MQHINEMQARTHTQFFLFILPVLYLLTQTLFTFLALWVLDFSFIAHYSFTHLNNKKYMLFNFSSMTKCIAWHGHQLDLTKQIRGEVNILQDNYCMDDYALAGNKLFNLDSYL